MTPAEEKLTEEEWQMLKRLNVEGPIPDHECTPEMKRTMASLTAKGLVETEWRDI